VPERSAADSLAGEEVAMAVRRTAEATARLRADLVEHARALVRRAGAGGLTMRALASESGCAVGLIYKVFDDREQLVLDVVTLELRDLAAHLERWSESVGSGTVAGNLDRLAGILLDSPTPALVHAEQIALSDLDRRLAERAEDAGFLQILDRAAPTYLAGEQGVGRVRADVDVEAIGFVVTGAVHNLVAAGAGYRRPSRAGLTRHLAEVARLIG
jgi:AcrR family transcriptional regulator